MGFDIKCNKSWKRTEFSLCVYWQSPFCLCNPFTEPKLRMKVQSHTRKRRNMLFQLRLHPCWTFGLLTVPSTANQTQQRLFHPRRLHNQQERAIWRCLCYTDRKESYSFRKNTIHSKSSIWNTRWPRIHDRTLKRSVNCSALSSGENTL